MICCTGVTPPPTAIPFQNEEEKIGGFALATADILGQMAADDYVNKLPLLYTEFVEAAAFTPEANDLIKSFSSAADLINKTPSFWEGNVKPKLEREFEGVSRFLNDPYPSGRNDYMERIEVNIEKIRHPNGGSRKQAEALSARSVA